MRVHLETDRLDREFLCPVDVPVTILGGKWKLLMLFFLLQEPRRNGAFRRLIPPISQKVLTQQLRELEADGLIGRTVVADRPLHVEYAVREEWRPTLTALVGALYDFGALWAQPGAAGAGAPCTGGSSRATG